MVCHSSAKIRRRRSEAYRKINNYVLMSFCLKKENYILMSFWLKKINTDRSVFIVEILQSKSKTIMSKKENYILMSFCLKKTSV